ncbi:hypothetical protein HZC31_01225 [Candidatus Woesearchaeota archaeon]|nr:hypothetical protein [Candidatus Woesearchaeota archaeon]
MKSHQKKYYGSLFVIMFLIVATAMLLTRSGNNNVTGMTTFEEGNQVSYLYYDGTDNVIYEDYLYYHNGNYYVKNSETDTELGKAFSSYGDAVTYMNEHVPRSAKKTVINLETDFSVISTYTIGEDAAYIRTKIADETASPFNVKAATTADAQTVSKAGKVETFDYAEDTNTLTVKIGGYTYEYKIVEIGGEYYAEKTSGGTKFYTDEAGVIWKYEGEKLVKTGSIESAFLGTDDKVLPVFSAVLSNEEERRSTAKKMEAYQKTATEIGGGVTGEDLYGEETAINAYLDLSESTKGVTYDVASGYYSGKTSEGTYIFHDKDGNTGTSVTVSKQDGTTTTINILKEKGTPLGKPTYYQCTTIDEHGICTAKVKYSGDTSDFSDAITDAKKADEDIQEGIQKQMEICKKPDNSACQLKSGDTQISATARQTAFMNRMYAEQEAKVQGLIAGWLNGWLDEKLGGWSRGVPAGICAYIFGLEYYKQDGWTRVTMNASVDQLQSQLIANSRTVIIEGEKEEITEDMFRYAYTVKLLANQSVEWQTYLYNSCTGETSVDTFYDYGSLLAGGYFAFHYAGAGAQDMIFECEQEICLYDQACVVFADGSTPTCVSLVHGAGFETPVAGNDYDCAITG